MNNRSNFYTRINKDNYSVLFLVFIFSFNVLLFRQGSIVVFRCFAVFWSCSVVPPVFRSCSVVPPVFRRVPVVPIRGHKGQNSTGT